MRREEFIREVAHRLKVPEQTASLTLHAIFSQVMIGLARDGEAGIPKLGDWRVLKNRAGRTNVVFEPTTNFLQTLALTRQSIAGASKVDMENDEELIHEGNLPLSLLRSQSQSREPVNLVDIFKKLSRDLGLNDTSTLFTTQSLTQDVLLQSESMKISNEIKHPGSELKINHENKSETSVDTQFIKTKDEKIEAENNVSNPTLSSPDDLKSLFDQMDDAKGDEVILSDVQAVRDESVEYDDQYFGSDNHQILSMHKKSPIGLNVAVVILFVLIAAGLYFMYSNDLLNRWLPKKYQHVSEIKRDKYYRIDKSNVKQSSQIVNAASYQMSKDYFLTVRLSPKQYDAKSRLKLLELQGFNGRVEKSTTIIGRKRWYKVKLGPFPTKDSAYSVSQRFQLSFGYPPTLDSLEHH